MLTRLKIRLVDFQSEGSELIDFFEAELSVD